VTSLRAFLCTSVSQPLPLHCIPHGQSFLHAACIALRCYFQSDALLRFPFSSPFSPRFLSLHCPSTPHETFPVCPTPSEKHMSRQHSRHNAVIVSLSRRHLDQLEHEQALRIPNQCLDLCQIDTPNCCSRWRWSNSDPKPKWPGSPPCFCTCR